MRFEGKVSSVRIVRALSGQGTLVLTVAIDFPAAFEGQIKIGDAVTVSDTLPFIAEPVVLNLNTTRRIVLQD
jgi:hypothetical protein